MIVFQKIVDQCQVLVYPLLIQLKDILAIQKLNKFFSKKVNDSIKGIVVMDTTFFGEKNWFFLQ